MANKHGRGLPEPTTEHGRQSRRRILQAAERVFGEKGYFPASITDITREAGVAQGTFYVHFRSKQDVFIELLDSLADVVLETCRAAVWSGENRLETEKLGLAAYFRFVSEHPNWYRIIRQAEFVDAGAFRNYYSRIASGYRRGLSAAIARGEISASDPETLAFCLMGVADLIGMRWPYWTGQPIPGDVFDAMMRFITYGLHPVPSASNAAQPSRRAVDMTCNPGRSDVTGRKPGVRNDGRTGRRVAVRGRAERTDGRA